VNHLNLGVHGQVVIIVTQAEALLWVGQILPAEGAAVVMSKDAEAMPLLPLLLLLPTMLLTLMLRNLEPFAGSCKLLQSQPCVSELHFVILVISKLCVVEGY